MWTIISEFLVKMVMAIISDKVLVKTAKTMLTKAVDSTVDKVGITDEDAKDIIHNITSSSLNIITDQYNIGK